MGAFWSSDLFFQAPAKASYSLATLGSPPLVFIHGIPCLWYPQKTDAPLILYLHCNFTDLGMQRNLCYQLSRQTGSHVLAMEYPGFGIYPGQPSTAQAVRSATLVYDWACSQSSQVYIMGRSIGSGVAGCLMQNLAETHARPVAGLILHSAFLSMAEVWAGYIGRTLAFHWLFNVMNTEYNLTHEPPPRLLVMHGAGDRLFSVWHAHQLYNRIPCPDKSLFVHPSDSHSRISWYELFPIIKSWLVKKNP